MKSPYLLTALLPAFMLFSCGDDGSKQPDVDSDSVVTTPPLETGPKHSTEKYAGTYSFGTDPEKEATGTLYVYPLTDSMAIVHLDVQKGAPSHNSGSLTQSVLLLSDTAMIWIGNNDDGECKIALHFTETNVTVQTHAGKGCGFGAGVMADNVYTRTSSEAPQYYFSGEGDTIRFKDHVEKGLEMKAH